MKPVILVTGANGILGRRTVEEFLRLPEARIIAALRKKVSGFPFKTKMIYGDLTLSSTWDRVPKEVTHVIHLAAQLPSGSTKGIKANNLKPIRHLLRVSKEWKNLRQIIFSSSISVYENKSVYSKSKSEGESLLASLKGRGVKICSLRFSSLYDFRSQPKTVLPIMVRNAAQSRTIHIYGKGKRTQDFLHARDAARAVVQAYHYEASGVFDIGSGRSTTMAELAKTIRKVFAHGQAKIVYDTARPEGPDGIQKSIRKAAQKFRYRPQISLKQGLLMMKKEMRKS